MIEYSEDKRPGVIYSEDKRPGVMTSKISNQWMQQTRHHRILVCQFYEKGQILESNLPLPFPKERGRVLTASSHVEHQFYAPPVSGLGV